MNLHFLSLERWLKNGSLDFARVSACAVGAKANVMQPCVSLRVALHLF